jgi:site-specific recombinase XerD
MDYLQPTEVDALLTAAHAYGNKRAHLCLALMYASGTRISQALNLKGVDIIPDPSTGGYRVRIRGAKKGRTRPFRVMTSNNPAFDMTPIVELARLQGTNRLFGGLTRFYMHILVKKFAATAGLHADMVSCHRIRHSTAMKIYTQSQRIGIVSAYLCHTDAASAFNYVAESDSQLGDQIMADVFANA